jgi:serine/threonine protein kinase
MGEFGTVFSGSIQKLDGGKRTIAIKSLTQPASETNKASFLREAGIMAQLDHPMVVAIVGIVTTSEPFLICLEFMEFGSLLSYLLLPMVKGKSLNSELTRFMCQIASGMHYVSQMGLIHRDLAARNVLINKDFVCKIADFGLSMHCDEIKDHKGDKIPVRWTAPEAFNSRKFSTASDVWSFGVLMWEIQSYGDQPYGAWTNSQILKNVSEGYRLPAPKKTPAALYSIMLETWDDEATERPGFLVLFQRLRAVHRSNLKSDASNGLYMPAMVEESSPPKRKPSIKSEKYVEVSQPGYDFPANQAAQPQAHARQTDLNSLANQLSYEEVCMFVHEVLFSHVR